MPIKRSFQVALVGGLLAACEGSDDGAPPAVTTMACSDFADKTIAGAAVTAATVVPAAGTVPEYCSVAATLPTKLKFEVRMPTAGWNGKLVYGGADSANGSAGGFDGFMPVPNVNALKMGYANVASDSGHPAAPRPCPTSTRRGRSMTRRRWRATPTCPCLRLPRRRASSCACATAAR